MPEEIQPDDIFDLGTWLGRKQAFAAVAGRCAAADAECLRTIRQKKLYRARGVTWEQFCTQYAGISRSLADEMIRRLEEFGPAYFHLSAVAKIAPKTFRLIAPAVSEEGVQIGDETILFTPENAPRIAAAIEELRIRAEARDAHQSDAPEHPAPSLARARAALDEALTEMERLSAFAADLVERRAARAAVEEGMRRLEHLLLVLPM